MNGLSLQAIVAGELAAAKILTAGGAKEVRAARCTLWASDMPGFGVRSYSTGRKVYVVQARMEGKTRTVTIGDARVVTRPQALDVARRVLLRAQVGENPAEVRLRTRGTPLFEDFLNEFWVKVGSRWKPSSMDRNIYYRAHLERSFSRKFLDKIEPGDVSDWFAMMTATSGPGAANRALQMLSAVFNKAEEWGVLGAGSNPCVLVKRNRPRKHECLLSADELSRFGKALKQLEASYPMEVAAIRLIALTGCRKSEICKLDWSEVRGRRLLLHDAKTGPRTIWIGMEAARSFDSIARHHAMTCVFWIEDRPLEVFRLDWIFRRARKEACLEHVRIHDLRHSFASHAAIMSETLPIIGKLLGHSSIAMTARYAHLDDGSVQNANEAIGAALRGLLEFQAPASEGEHRTQPGAAGGNIA